MRCQKKHSTYCFEKTAGLLDHTLHAVWRMFGKTSTILLAVEECWALAAERREKGSVELGAVGESQLPVQRCRRIQQAGCLNIPMRMGGLVGQVIRWNGLLTKISNNQGRSGGGGGGGGGV